MAITQGPYRGQYKNYETDIVCYYTAGLHAAEITRKLARNDLDYGQCRPPRFSAVYYIITRIFGRFHEPPFFTKEVDERSVRQIDNRILYRGLRA